MSPKRSISTSDRVNQLLNKEEPTFTGLPELSKMELVLALNWYSQNKDKEVSHKYLTEYCKVYHIKVAALQIQAQVPTLGFVCRMVMRGALLDVTSKIWLTNHLTSLSILSKPELLSIELKETPVATPVVKPATIQDRLKAQSNKCIGALEESVDEFIITNFKKDSNILEILREHNIKGVHGPNIINYFKKCRDEFRDAMSGHDEQLNEGYSNYSVPQMKKMEALYDQIISDTLTIMGEANATKSPRAKKIKSPEKQVKSLKFCQEDTDLKIKSLPPTRMIGAEGVFTYHRKSRLLSYYIADDAGGLGIKGCTFTNYSKSKSRTKKLRKPEEVLPKILSGGKVYLKKIMDELTTKDVRVTGRLNSETLLVKVIV